MLNVKQQIAELLASKIDGMDAVEIEKLIEIPSDSSMGDYAFPCFKLAKVMRKAPNMIAADIASSIENESMFETVRPVNAYVNMFMKKGASYSPLIVGLHTVTDVDYFFYEDYTEEGLVERIVSSVR